MVEVVSHGNLEIRLELLDPIGQGLAANPLQRFFAGAVDRRQQQGITVLQCTCEGLEEFLGAAEAVGLKHSKQPLRRAGQWAAATAHHELRHGQGGLHLTGMVGVVVDDVSTLPGAPQIKTTAGRFQGCESVHQPLEGNPLHPAGG